MLRAAATRVGQTVKRLRADPRSSGWRCVGGSTALELDMFIAIALSTIAAIVAVYGIALWVDALPR